MDVLAAFLADCCLRDEDEEAFAGELWGAWKRWCEETGEKKVGTQKRFGGQLAERGFLNHRYSRTGRKVWSGVGLRPNRESRAGLALNHSSARFAGNRAQPEPSEPKTDKVPDNILREETLRKKGSEGSARRALGDLEDRPHGVMGGCELCR
jgi:phage/plasmid-associated DNA primase